MNLTGNFVWHDLMTTDRDAALDFYTALLGWTYGDHSMGEGEPYKMITVGEKTLGGISSKPAEQPGPPHWIGYVFVDDVDAAVERATRMGGTSLVPPTDIPDVGRFAFLSDPQGAIFAVYRNEGGDDGADLATGAGTFVWNELISPDPDAIVSFYGEVFGWKHKQFPMGDMGTYTMFQFGETEVAGLMSTPPGGPPQAMWVHYLQVDDVDVTAARIEELGGQIHHAPTDIPDVGRFCVAADPQGAAVAFFKGASKP